MSILDDYEMRAALDPLTAERILELVGTAESRLQGGLSDLADNDRAIVWLHDRLQAVYAALENLLAPTHARCAWCLRAAGGTDEAWRALPALSMEDSAAHAQVCEHNPLVRALADERAAYAALKPELDRREDKIASLEATLADLQGRKIGKADAWAAEAGDATEMYHYQRKLHEALKGAIRALLDTETPAGELRKAIAELVR